MVWNSFLNHLLECQFRVATVREKCLKNEIFSWSGKNQGICGWPVKFRKDLESQGKVKEFENIWLWQSSENLFILFKGERMYFFMR